ncbi:LexA family transcriptional regulator [Campylobacter curvus]|uniref:LexA family transcriptional regulator n=1 Tax=Campylobacter curvus TaxID=200 RepID=UPI0014706383|nr:S24 family peptidase [Campylobacter curvus]
MINEAKQILDKWLLEQNLKTYKELADFLGVAQNTLDVWKQRGKIPEKNILKYTHLATNSEADTPSDIIDTPNLKPYNIKKITAYKASAGGGNEIDDIKAYETGELMPIAKAFFKTPPKKELNAIEISGESMLPMLHDGDWVIFCDDGEFRGDGLYVVNFSGQLMAKVLQLSPKGELKIISVNPNFASYEIDINETQEHFRIIGKVIKSIV